MSTAELAKMANKIRQRDLRAVFEAGAGHVGGEMSVIDLLTVLYFKILQIDPKRPTDPLRDRFVLSKGHSALALYITLSEKGFFPPSNIGTFLQHHSALNGHPNRVKVPGIETNTGPLGHGLPIAAGMATAAKLNEETWRTFVITGDGEMQEGSNWEAIMYSAQANLDNLTLIIDHNRLQQGSRLSETVNIAPLAQKLESFGWATEEIDGHNYEEIETALSLAKVIPNQPKCIIAHTHKGHGISFMSDEVAWHHKVPSEEQYLKALAELKEAAK